MSILIPESWANYSGAFLAIEYPLNAPVAPDCLTSSISTTGLSGFLLVGFSSTYINLKIIDRILNGALTSELTLEWEGL